MKLNAVYIEFSVQKVKGIGYILKGLKKIQKKE
jgi:hypothetical protein